MSAAGVLPKGTGRKSVAVTCAGGGVSPGGKAEFLKPAIGESEKITNQCQGPPHGGANSEDVPS